MTRLDGGRPARRAIARWSLRLLRREWRQQVLVVGLLGLVVAASVVFTAGGYDASVASDDATFGTARHRYEADLPEPSALRVVAAAATEQYGVAGISVSWFRPIPGLADEVEIRSVDPEAPFSEPLLALRDGRYPTEADEVGLTDDLAAVLGVELGADVDFDGQPRQVVGVVENPNELASDFALAAPSDRGRAERVTVLFDGPPGPVVRGLDADGLQLREVSITTRSHGGGLAMPASVLGVTAVALLLVSLVAATGFLALAQRRLRQLGVLVSIGATEAHLRRVVVLNGFAVGVVAAVLGGALGLLAWTTVSVTLEEAAGHRIDPSDLPWTVVLGPLGLTVIAATLAAWWPARVVARVPAVSALSGRPPAPRPVRRSTATAAGCLAASMLCLAWAGSNPVLLVVGTIATVGGVLLVSPIALRIVARLVNGLPLAIRLATRDLARHQSRAGAALAAISLALGIPAAIVVTSTAAEADERFGNLPDDSVVVWTRDPSQPQGVSPYYTEDPNDEGFSPYLPDLSDGDLDDMAAVAEEISAAVSGERVTPLELVADPGAVTPDGRLSVSLALPAETGSFDVAPLFLASDRLLDAYGLDTADVRSGPGLISVDDLARRLPGEARQQLTSDEPLLSNTADRRTAPAGDIRLVAPAHTSLPGSMVTPAEAERQGWEPVVVGWLIDAADPVSSGEVGAARDIALGAGLLVEPPERHASLQAIRWQATGTGLAVALGVLAATAGLLRREAEPDLRTLTAAGATTRIRRSLSASSCAALSLLGGVLGTAGAYLGLAAGHLDDPGHLLPVPIVPLLVLVVGTPLLAASISWMVSGRAPASLSRAVIE
jgi:putative ABC transport system permease protein